MGGALETVGSSHNDTISVAADGVLHVWREGKLEYCSTAEPWTDETGCGLDWGNCPHHVDVDGCPTIVALRRRATG